MEDKQSREIEIQLSSDAIDKEFGDQFDNLESSIHKDFYRGESRETIDVWDWEDIPKGYVPVDSDLASQYEDYLEGVEAEIKQLETDTVAPASVKVDKEHPEYLRSSLYPKSKNQKSNKHGKVATTAGVVGGALALAGLTFYGVRKFRKAKKMKQELDERNAFFEKFFEDTSEQYDYRRAIFRPVNINEDVIDLSKYSQNDTDHANYIQEYAKYYKPTFVDKK